VLGLDIQILAQHGGDLVGGGFGHGSIVSQKWGDENNRGGEAEVTL
jgi:hypothetical protein